MRSGDDGHLPVIGRDKKGMGTASPSETQKDLV